MGPGTKKAVKNLMRQLYGVRLNNAELNTLMRQARKGIAQSNLEAEQYIARPNPFQAQGNDGRAAAVNRLGAIDWNSPNRGIQALRALVAGAPAPIAQAGGG